MTKRALSPRAAALIGAIVLVLAASPASSVWAQETPSVALEQARSGEDGTSGAGAASGNMSSGEAKRDKNGNASTASAGSGGSTGGSEDANAPELPENAELLDALGILDDVTVYGIDVLTGLDIPVELLPPPAEPVSSVPDDINTGGQGSSSTISTEPGTGSAPAGGSISTAAEDGTGSSASGEPKRDRPRKNADGETDTATSGS